MRKLWRGREIDKQQAEEISKKMGINVIIAGIAQNRFKEKTLEIEKYGIETLTNPFKMPDMDVAVDRILEAIDNQEKILIYGDYDADGITATTILKMFFEEQGMEVAYYIPNRLTEGYGVKSSVLEEFKNMGYSLVITVDTGITAIEEAKYAKQIGLDFLVTDHHEMQEEKPEAIAVVDYKRTDIETNEFKDIAGCFVAFKLVQALCDEMGIEQEYYEKFIPFAMLGTIADVMPLIMENRSLVKMGLKNMFESEIPSIKVISNYLTKTSGNISAVDIAFKIIPMLNAAGRLGKEVGAEFLMSKTIEEAENLWEELKKVNDERKKIVEKITEEAVGIVEQEGDKKGPILVYGKWHEGVVGIIAAKLVEKFQKPAIVMSLTEEGMYVGSGRSKHINIFELVMKIKEKTEKFGGHANAIGLSVLKENIEQFKKEFENLELEEAVEIVEYDMPLKFKMTNTNLIKSFKILEPMGEKNPVPTFMYKDVEIGDITEYEKVVRITFLQDGIRIVGMTFDKKKTETIQKGDNVYIIGKPSINTFGGKESVQLEIVDINVMKK